MVEKYCNVDIFMYHLLLMFLSFLHSFFKSKSVIMKFVYRKTIFLKNYYFEQVQFILVFHELFIPEGELPNNSLTLLCSFLHVI